MKKILGFLFVILLCFALNSCDENNKEDENNQEDQNNPKEVERSFSLGITECEIDLGDYLEVNPVIQGFEGEIDWFSDDEEIAFAMNNKIYTKKIGTCTIYAEIEEFQETIAVTVKEKVIRELNVSKEELNFVGEGSEVINITKIGIEGKLNIYSTNNMVASYSIDDTLNTPDANNVTINIYSRGAGNCNIVIECDDVTKNICVNVENPEIDPETIKSITTDIERCEIIEGQTQEVHVTTKNISGELSWSSTDNSIATVSNGVITAVKEGRCVIILIGDNVTVVINVIVKSKYYLTDELFLNMQFCDLTIGETKNIVVMNKTLEGSVLYSSSNTSVATVSNGVIKAIKAGKCIITVKVGDLTKTIEVTVKAKPLTEGEI